MAHKLKLEENSDNIRLDLPNRSFYQFPLLAAQINGAIGRAYVQRYGRPAHGWRVLTVLGNFGPMSATEITRRSTLEIDRITRIVDSLVDQGLVTRQQDKEDRRKIVVTLTAKGKRNCMQIEQMIGDMEREFLIVISAAERDQLYSLLDRLKTRADQLFRNPGRWIPG